MAEKAGRDLNTHPHLEEALQRDADQLRAKIGEMTRIVERNLKLSLQALVEANRTQAYSVILRDQYVDDCETEINRLCLEFLVRHQPAGLHLRLVYTTIQVNKELERIGDYAESIARQALTLSTVQPRPAYERFIELGDLALHMLSDAVQAYLRQDSDLAWRTMPIEERANVLRNSINAELAELSRQGRLPEVALNPLITAARRLERAADQAKNLCEDVLYLCTGEFIKHRKGEGFLILFLDYSNSCLGQMAEGLGKSLALPRFAFASAGRVPRALDPEAVRFMAQQGMDISTQASKSMEQVRNWENAQVIVALDKRALDGLQLHSNKPIVLQWLMTDPSEIQEPEARKAAFQSAYQSLQSNLKELAAAILDEPQPELKV